MTVYLKDYQPPSYQIETVDLCFQLNPDCTRVFCRLTLRRRVEQEQDLRLDGEGLKPIFIRLNGQELSQQDYAIDEHGLTLFKPPAEFILETEVEIQPAQNTALEGLYCSQNLLCTQCEAEGFRRITWYLDRPDVMARFKVRLEADRQAYPVLLSNGNLIATGELPQGHHYAEWEDPFPKPSYLFALVAGDLACYQDRFISRSGRRIDLKLYVEAHHLDQCQHAMDSLKKAMAWEEQVYDREYDLDAYHMVAVSHFNMGAMENKGLNLFNAQYVLAHPEMATDEDYLNIEAIIAHEYFHNWTGNRITCRDWFQLSLKEGLTVFREQQFCADQHSPGVKRIQDVRLLKTLQFAEDDGPMAHPVQPQSYEEINNFYTYTIYEKGAELVRMQFELLGAERFYQGMALYFERYDGQAVTIDDFVACMQAAAGMDLSRFKRWYHQIGTPCIQVREEYQPQQQRYILHLHQDQQPPLMIPIKMALFDAQGNKIHQDTLILDQSQQSFEFNQMTGHPIPSLLRAFSAPVKLQDQRSPEELLFLLQHDDDPFNRWQAGQNLMQHLILQGGDAEALILVLQNILEQESDAYLAAELLSLPSLVYLSEQIRPVPLESLYQAHDALKQSIAQALYEIMLERYQQLHFEDYVFDAQQVGGRRLKAVLLDYIAASSKGKNIVLQQYWAQQNMTEVMAALRLITDSDWPEKARVLADFEQRWQHENTVINKWFQVQALSRHSDVRMIKQLQQHPLFSMQEPNKLRALIGQWSQKNLIQFHAMDGSGYAYLADCIIALDRINPQMAARLLRPLTQWAHYDWLRQQKMKAELERVKAKTHSKDVQEIAGKGLAI